MKIPMCESLKVAHDVIKLVSMPKSKKEYVRLESWSNCREQGLCIKDYSTLNTRALVISQHRSSDDILIIWGKREDFDYQTNQPNDEIWQNNRVHFNYNQVKQAASYIKHWIINEGGKYNA